MSDFETNVMPGQTLVEHLLEICEDVHSACGPECPVYKLNGNKVPNQENSRWGCDCFKDGEKMHTFIHNN